MIASLVIRMRLRGAEEEGVIALATLGFMIAAGMAVIVLLWSIGVITGAYNSLYAANQAAAYAAASATTAPVDANSSSQLAFQCNYASPGSTLCVGGGSYDAAQSVMGTMLNTSRPGDFGLQYGSNVAMTLNAYSINRTPSEAKAEANAYGCGIPAGSDAGYTAIEGNPTDLELNCWDLKEEGVDFGTQYTSAVVARSTANVNVLPGCGLTLCNTTINVVAAASEDQPNPYTCYSEYYGTTCSLRTPPPASQPAPPTPPTTQPKRIPLPASGKCPNGYRKKGRWCLLK